MNFIGRKDSINRIVDEALAKLTPEELDLLDKRFSKESSRVNKKLKTLVEQKKWFYLYHEEVAQIGDAEDLSDYYEFFKGR